MKLCDWLALHRYGAGLNCERACAVIVRSRRYVFPVLHVREGGVDLYRSSH